MQELGFQNFIMAESWGLLAPAGLPNDVSRKLRDSMISVIQQPDVIKRCDEQGVTLKSSTPQQLQDYIQSEIKKYREVIINAKIKVE
jgi:tripartite-type tricarboxylate transporter receptor subunit TctC